MERDISTTSTVDGKMWMWVAPAAADCTTVHVCLVCYNHMPDLEYFNDNRFCDRCEEALYQVEVPDHIPEEQRLKYKIAKLKKEI